MPQHIWIPLRVLKGKRPVTSQIEQRRPWIMAMRSCLWGGKQTDFEFWVLCTAEWKQLQCWDQHCNNNLEYMCKQDQTYVKPQGTSLSCSREKRSHLKDSRSESCGQNEGQRHGDFPFSSNWSFLWKTACFLMFCSYVVAHRICRRLILNFLLFCFLDNSCTLKTWETSRNNMPKYILIV